MKGPAEFGILGPLQVRWEDGPPLALGGPRQRGILAALLVHANEVVSTERLVDELWGERPPAGAVQTIRVAVSRLRSALGPAGARLVTQPPGYVLELSDSELDAARCEALYVQARDALAAGDPAGAVALLREAEALWRGPALAEFSYEPFAQAAISRLGELRVSCLEERIEAELTLGRHADVVHELAALVREHPFRERPRGQLMLALYRSGRQAEALEAFQDTRKMLVEELAVEPSTALRELEQAILRQDPALRGPQPRGPEPPPPQTQPPPALVRKTATVLVATLAWRGESGDVEPETTQLLAAAAQEHAAQIVTRHGGSFVSGPGSELLAVFGVPAAREDDALRALRAADELRVAVAALVAGEPGALALGIGLDTGEVVGGAAALVGEPVSGAAALAAQARSGAILLSDTTRRLAPDAIQVEPAAAPGSWRLLAVIPGAPAVRRRLGGPMIGRDGELAAARAAFEGAVRAGDTRLLTVFGEAGLGKSRLAHELAQQLQSTATVLAGRCLSYGDGVAFWPLREAIVSAAGGESRAAVRALLDDAGDADLVADIVATTLGLGGAEVIGEQVPWAFRRLFEQLALRRPLLLIVEDAHWAEGALLDLLDYLVDWMTAPVLILCLARPELLDTRPAWGGGQLRVSSLVLAPLGEDEALDLLTQSAAARGLSDDDRARILDTAEGNPLFVEQLLAMRTEDPWWDRHRAVPATLQALLTARLDRLGPGERACIERAAVVGREFWPAAVVELLPAELRPSAGQHLRRLVQRELVRPERSTMFGEQAMRFHHILIRDVAYRTMPKALRADLHARFSDWLERRRDDADEFIGYHLEQAFGYRRELRRLDADSLQLAARAAERLASAGRRALARGDANAGGRLLGRAAELFAVCGHERPDVLLDLGGALSESGDFDGAGTALEQALALARATGSDALTARTLIELSYRRLLGSAEGVAEMMAVADEAIALSDGDEAGMARALLHKAEAHWVRSSCAEMEDTLESALGHADGPGAERQRSQILGWLARGTMIGPRHASDGVERCHRILARAGSDVALTAVTEAMLAVLESMRGNPDEARRFWAASARRLEDAGLAVMLAGMRMYSGFVELMCGTPGRAEAGLTEGYALLSRVGERGRAPTVAAVLARTLYAVGRYDEAERYVRESARATAPDDAVTQVMWRSTLAKVLVRAGRGDEAILLADEAVRLAERTDFLLIHADALADRAELFGLLDGAAAAAADLDAAVTLYERKGATACVAAARQLS